MKGNTYNKVVYSEKRTPLSELWSTNISEERRPISLTLTKNTSIFHCIFPLFFENINNTCTHKTNIPFTTHRKQFHWTKFYMNISFGNRPSSTNIYIYVSWWSFRAGSNLGQVYDFFIRDVGHSLNVAHLERSMGDSVLNLSVLS